ncbi:hypothetical protein CASFOL_026873 [Castilleja foliolosa]|uniref:RING-type domain-containing protein n=1 Tax=Castilleja foliolosa TaxID=1961234 RepID=A0ABD3CL31_9LAMI
MAGVLPGVEAARRRRFHKSSDNDEQLTSTRRSSLCLYATSHVHQSNSSIMQIKNPSTRQESRIVCDESTLGVAAREAKKRLDERLQPQKWRSQKDRSNIQSNMQPEVPNLKRNGLKKLSWLKLSWKSSEQDECAVCLERLRAGPGQIIMQLPCSHRFHAKCLVPWLEAKSHCPCCRLEIPS